MTDTAHDRQFGDTPSDAVSDGALARALRPLSERPMFVALLGIVLLSGLGWIYLGAMAAGPHAPFGSVLGDIICRPGLGQGGSAANIVSQSAPVVLMWCAMVLAMMLPTAGPMIVTYAEIADAAARKGEAVVTPLIFMGGYVTAWLGFVVAASASQLALMQAALLDATMRIASPLIAGVIILLAGCYQFSALKHACVTHCQRPFPFFFAHWTDEAAGVFRLGMRQGLYCLGCCWAMMLVMVAVGVMNVAWMAALGVAMGMEKLVTTPRLSRAVGAGLIAAGVAFIVSGSGF
jgi:predicted metal-binding membrane protein